MTAVMNPCSNSVLGPILQTGQSAYTTAANKLTVGKFTSEYSKHFPVRFVVTKGFYGHNEDLRFSEGDRFRAHSVKQSTVINIEFDNNQRSNIPSTSTIPFAILYNPHDNLNEAMVGYRFEKVSELFQLSVLPLVLWSRKAYQGSSPDSSLSANELLIVRKVKSRLVRKQQLKVYSLTQKREKTLYTSCVGSFSTKPRDISLHLSDILKFMPDIFPCHAVMFNPHGKGKTMVPGAPVSRQDSCLVTMMHSSIDTSLVVSSALKETFESSGTRYLDIPIDLGILVKLDKEPDAAEDGSAVYEDATLYNHFDKLTSSEIPQQSRSQFYTNVNFGHQQPNHTNLLPVGPCNHGNFTSAESAIEEGYYQTPKSERTLSDPIAIESVYHPPDSSYVCLMKDEDGGKKGSYEKSPGSEGELKDASSPSSSWRPPLPPPNKIRRDHQRSPGYAYVETNPLRSTHVCHEGGIVHRQAAENGSNGSILSSSNPDSAHSERSFDSSGSGGAVVDRRGSIGNRPSQRLLSGQSIGSGDGIVERSMRTSSISSAGYSYAKTNTEQRRQPSPTTPTTTNLPTSPHHYSHLRSRSGPPILPQQLPLLSLHAQRPVTTTRIDPNNSDTLVVVQRKGETPLNNGATTTPIRNLSGAPFSNGFTTTPVPSHGGIQRQESAPVIRDVGVVSNGVKPSPKRPDSLSTVLDDLEKMTQELDLFVEEDVIFAQDDMSPISPSSNSKTMGTNETQPVPPSTSSTPSSSSQQQPQDTLSPEVIEKHKSYLKAMDNYQILRLLEMMRLEQYTPIFQQEQINGDILSTCDDALLKDELKITSRLHRMRLLRVIEGTYSIYEMMSGKDGYIFMRSAGNQ